MPDSPEVGTPLIVEIDLSSPRQVEDFLSRHGDKLKIKERFNTCSDKVEIKIKYASFISEDQLVFEFVTDEDKKLYRTSDEVKFIVVE